MTRSLYLLASAALIVSLAAPLNAQTAEPNEPPIRDEQMQELLEQLESEAPEGQDRRGDPDFTPDENLPNINGLLDRLDEIVPPDQVPGAGGIDPDTGLATGEASSGAPSARPDVVILSDKDRKEQLDKLFDKLAKTDDSDAANLVAEEIWAIWLQSGSASVDYLLLRGTTAQKAGNRKLARRMYERVIALEPDYAEGWTRSGRLAMDEDDLPKALHDITKSLTLEPRHFYSLWTLGNIFERLEQTENAFEAYEEALALYPALDAVQARVDALRESVEGRSL